MARGELAARITEILSDIQATLYARALSMRDANTHVINTRADFDAFFASTGGKESQGGFALAHWSGDPEIEAEVRVWQVTA